MLSISYDDSNLLSRDQVCRFIQERSDFVETLDSTTKKIVDAITKQEDVFRAAHDAQISLLETIQDELVITRREIIKKIKVRFFPV
jgi:hypothetical protein